MTPVITLDDLETANTKVFDPSADAHGSSLPGKSHSGGSSEKDRRTSEWDISAGPKNFLLLVIFQFGMAAFSVLSVWLATKYLGAQGYGGLSSVIVFSQVAQIVIMWTCSAVVRFGVAEFVETGSIAKTFWARTAIFIPNLIAVVALTPIWFPYASRLFELPADSTATLVLLIVSMALAMHVQFSLQAAKLPSFQGALQMLEKAATFVILLILAIGPGLSVASAILAFALPPLVSTIVGSVKLWPLISKTFALEKTRIGQILRFSLPLPIYSILSVISLNHLDAIFVVKYLSLADFGVYSVAYQVNGLVLQLPALAGSLLLPLFVTASSSDQQDTMRARYFSEALPLVTLSIGILCVAAAAVGTVLLPRILGSDFSSVGLMLWVFAAACALSTPVGAGFLPLTSSVSQTSTQMIAAFFSAIVKLGLNFMLIPMLGLSGSAWATVAAYTTALSVYFILTRRHLDLAIAPVALSLVPTVAAAVTFELSTSLSVSLLVFIGGIILLFVIRRDLYVNGLEMFRAMRRRMAAQ